MLKHIPLLEKQRRLYDLPLGRERFNAYIDMMTDDQRDMELPLSGLNPMGKAHLPDILDGYLELDLDNQAEKLVADLATTPTVQEGFAHLDMRSSFVLADDLKGGWTHRGAYEFEQVYAQEPLFKRGWLVAFLWSSETPQLETALTALKTSIFRGVWMAQHGFQKTLEGLINQEGWVADQLGMSLQLTLDDLQYTRDILEPLLTHKDMPTLIAALFGDAAAKQLGYPPLGLSPNAGIEWGLARQQTVP